VCEYASVSVSVILGECVNVSVESVCVDCEFTCVH
jgi:hypothetical protein